MPRRSGAVGGGPVAEFLGWFLHVLPWSLFWLLTAAVVRQWRHVRSLRRQLGPVPDVWEIRCQRCGRPLRRGRALVCEERHVAPGGTVTGMQVRAWHADRPKCSADFATDRAVMETYLDEGES